MKCLTCQHLDLRQYPKHARTGFGRCEFETFSGVFVSTNYTCDRHKEAKAEIVEARIEFYRKEAEALRIATSSPTTRR